MFFRHQNHTFCVSFLSHCGLKNKRVLHYVSLEKSQPYTDNIWTVDVIAFIFNTIKNSRYLAIFSLYPLNLNAKNPKNISLKNTSPLKRNIHYFN